MVDVTPKDPTHRRATARCKVFMKPETTMAVANREVTKGDVLAVARRWVGSFGVTSTMRARPSGSRWVKVWSDTDRA